MFLVGSKAQSLEAWELGTLGNKYGSRLSRCVVSYKLHLVGTWFVVIITRMHIVQELMLLKGEIEATMLKNHLPYLLVPIAHQVIVVHVCKVHSVDRCDC